MNLQVGDKVKFLNDIGEGTVIKINENKTVIVETSDGFEFPMHEKELLKIEPASTDFFFKATPQTVEKQIINEEVKKIELPIELKENEEVNIYLAFIPVDQNKPSECNQKLQLLNDSNWHIRYVYQVKKNINFESYIGDLQPNCAEVLHEYKLQEINEIKEIKVQIIFYRTELYESKEPISTSISIKAQKFYSPLSYQKNNYFDEKAIFFTILEENPLKEAMKKLNETEIGKVIKNKEIINKKINTTPQYVKPPKDDTIEVDLHLVELLDDAKGMSPKEMVDFQLTKFKEELEKAKIIHHVKKIVFIHGKGNGKLRSEIRTYLEMNKIKFQDASFQKYGFGATLVFV